MGAAETGFTMTFSVIFSLEEHLYAIRLSEVSRVVRAAEITPLPDAPPIVIGVINLGGRVLPVVNLRKRFRLPERDLALTDQFIVARSGGRFLVLVVDAVLAVRDLPVEETVAAETILPGLKHVKGVARTDQGLVLIHDLGTFLSLDERDALDLILPGEKE